MAAPRKHPSGAQKRKAAHEKREAAADAKLTDEQRTQRDLDLDLERKDYAELGRPPADTVGRVAWAQAMMATAIYWAARTALDARETRRMIFDGGQKIGHTAVKALYEERLTSLEAKVFGRRKKVGKKSDETDTVDESGGA